MYIYIYMYVYIYIYIYIYTHFCRHQLYYYANNLYGERFAQAELIGECMRSHESLTFFSV